MKVLARGTYLYSRDGELQPITEPWTLSAAAGGALRLEGERLRTGKALLRVDARLEAGRCTAMKLQWLIGIPRTFEYELLRNAVKWHEGSTTGRLSMPGGGLMFPLLRAATGPLVAELARSPAFVVVPNLYAPASPKFLQPEATPRRATFLGNRYEYYGGEYEDDGCECWLDERGLLKRYIWKTPQGTWDVRLEEFEADPEFKGFR